MRIEQGLNALLLADRGVGKLAASRIYPVVAPQNVAYPVLVYQAGDDERETSQSGSLELVTTPIQIVAIGSSHEEVQELARMVRAAVLRPSDSWGGVRVFGAACDSQGPVFDQETKTWAVALAATIRWRE